MRTLPDAIRALHQFDRAYRIAVLYPLRRGMRNVKDAAARGYKLRGLGRVLWSGNREDKAGVPRLRMTSRARYSASSETWTGTVRATGMAALIEEGGRTKPHTIKARSGGKLVFKARDGRVLRLDRVQHTGSRVKQNEQLPRSLRERLTRITGDIDHELQKLGDKVVG